MTRPREIIEFWFGAKGEARKRWFQQSEAFDAEIRTRFGAAVERALSGDFADWEKNAEGALALILLLDQFPRNIWRGSARAFSGDGRALVMARRAIAAGFDRQRPELERVFFYLPFEHSEDIADQRTSLRLMRTLADAEYCRYAEAHRDIIVRFGRFPHRNAVLGRTSTPEELEFLKQPGSSF